LSSALALRLVVVRAVFLRFVALFWGSLSLPDVREPERVRG
jgi:hypothetical protein